MALPNRCVRREHSRYKPSPDMPFGPYLNCPTDVQAGLFGCLSVFQSDICKNAGVNFGGFGGGGGVDMTAGGTDAPKSMAAICKCSEAILECVVDAGCTFNITAISPEAKMQCEAGCPGSSICAASSIAVNGAALLLAIIAIVTTSMFQ